MLYRYLPKSAGLRRITLHKSISSGDKMYLLLCECSNFLENLSAAALLLPALRARLCGYTGLYRTTASFWMSDLIHVYGCCWKNGQCSCSRKAYQVSTSMKHLQKRVAVYIRFINFKVHKHLISFLSSFPPTVLNDLNKIMRRRKTAITKIKTFIAISSDTLNPRLSHICFSCMQELN